MADILRPTAGPHGFAPEMAYRPRSTPAFSSDIQHDFRDHMLATRLESLSYWVSEASQTYLRAATLLQRHRIDALAISLDADLHFDARTLFVAHDHMAAHWRNGQMRDIMAGGNRLHWGPQQLYSTVNSYRELLALFRQWLLWQIKIWGEAVPDLLELFRLAVVGEHTRSGQSVEAELYYTLADLYPVPGRHTQKPLPVSPRA